MSKIRVGLKNSGFLGHPRFRYMFHLGIYSMYVRKRMDKSVDLSFRICNSLEGSADRCNYLSKFLIKKIFRTSVVLFLSHTNHGDKQ